MRYLSGNSQLKLIFFCAAIPWLIFIGSYALSATSEYVHGAPSKGNPLHHGCMYQDDNTTETVIDTIDVWEEVDNFTASAEQVGWSFSGGGDLTASSGAGGVYHITASASSFRGAGVSQQFEFAISINDVVNDECEAERIFTTTDIGDVGFSCIDQISPGDVMKLEVRNRTSDINITVRHGNISLHRI